MARCLDCATAVPPLLVLTDAVKHPWTDAELGCNRRVVLIHRICSATFKAETTAISCILWEQKKEHVFTSADFFKVLQFLFMGQVDALEKKIYRRILDRLNNSTTIRRTGEYQEFFNLINRFHEPKPTPNQKDFKVFPWACIDLAVRNCFKKKNSPNKNCLKPTEWMPYTPPISLHGPPTISVCSLAERSSPSETCNSPSSSAHYPTQPLIPTGTSGECVPPAPSQHPVANIPRYNHPSFNLNFPSLPNSEQLVHFDPELQQFLGQGADLLEPHDIQNSISHTSSIHPQHPLRESWDDDCLIQHSTFPPAPAWPSNSLEPLNPSTISQPLTSQVNYDTFLGTSPSNHPYLKPMTLCGLPLSADPSTTYARDEAMTNERPSFILEWPAFQFPFE